ncbi:ankyrin [Parathielavia hyrcaniae]|uniref:Ankyrin n=1 Tax=Parathielavia hyrcaniae TaxID=113614 RepID=A0AAN6SYW5_9PEZI|nr:ankyrin [Parathielavia hyrcaniae]
MELMAGASAAVSPPAPRRGRREKPWPPGKQKKLLRLYVCTQSERLPLVRILERLKDGSFDPRQRNSHKHLKNLLPDRRIDDWRPRDLATMLVRVRFLRSVRAERRIRNMKTRRRLEPQPHSCFAHDRLDAPGSRMSVDQPAIPPEPQTASFAPSPITDSPSTVKQSESAGSTPLAISTASASDTHRRDKSPSRAPSTTPSTKSAKRRSWASVLSSISSGISSLARSSSSASSKGANVNASGANTALSKMTRDEFLAMLQEKPRRVGKAKAEAAMGGLFKSKFSSVNPTAEELNAELVRTCCAAHVSREEPSCVHERLSRAIAAQHRDSDDYNSFRVTEEEANVVDPYGNSLLHVAARWGARVSILLMILKRTDDIQMVNQRGETFLHVFDPPQHPPMRPVSFLNLIRTLRSRHFDFCHRDVDKHTFLHHLVARKAFPIETLYYVFREVGHGAARFLVANKSAGGERLWHSVRTNLERSAPKLHRIFGDEVEFIRRYLPEFSEGRTPSTADTSTIGSDSLASIHPTEVPALHLPVDPNEGNAHKVRRTPVMKLFRRAAAGRGLSDAELTTKLGAIFDAAPKQQTEFSMKDYLGKRDTEGNTALHYAAEFGLVPAVQFLCAKGASVNVFNNCGNTPLQLVKFAIQRTDVRSDIHMEARYLRCAVLLLEHGAFDQSKLVSERSVIYPYDVFDGSERSISNLVRQGVASQCRGLHLLTRSVAHHGPGYVDGLEHEYHHGCQGHHHEMHAHDQQGGEGGGGGGGGMGMATSMTFQTSALLT